jgi:hypothetical protein
MNMMMTKLNHCHSWKLEAMVTMTAHHPMMTLHFLALCCCKATQTLTGTMILKMKQAMTKRKNTLLSQMWWKKV